MPTRSTLGQPRPEITVWADALAAREENMGGHPRPRPLLLAVSLAMLPIVFACSRPPEKPAAPATEVARTPTCKADETLVANQAEPSQPRPSNRIVVKTTRDAAPAEVSAELRRTLDAVVDASPLFEVVDPKNDPEQLRRFFLVSFSPQDRLASLHPWDVAYGARNSKLIADSAPDQDHVLADAMMRSGPCFGHVTNYPKDWAHDMVGAHDAWAITPAKHARGIKICHPDTGWAEHEDLDRSRLDTSKSLDLIDGSADAHDPLDYSGGFLNPGHGTGTGSVIMSGGDVTNDDATPGDTTSPGVVTGMAPEATLIPIRAAKSVVQVFDSDLARAVQHSTRVGGDVISMSLGGAFFFALHAAIRDAVQKGLLVLSAAGNCVPFVVAPASYAEVIGVAAVNHDSMPWNGTSQGPRVAISAPGQDVWHAVRAPEDDGNRKQACAGHGTSYAVAMTAGAAALWLDAHRTATGVTPPEPNLQEVFRKDLRDSARVPTGWDTQNMGAGILNAKDLVWRAAHPSLAAPPPMRPPATPSELLAGFVQMDEATSRRNISQMLGIPPASVPSFLDSFGHEVMAILMADPKRLLVSLRTKAAMSEARAVALRGSVLENASRTLRKALER